MHSESGKAGEIGCPGQVASGWDGQPTEWGTQEGWGLPSPSLAACKRAAELQRQHFWLQGREGVNWIQIPPLC